QQIATSGDLSEATLTFSNDGGRRWANPRPLTTRPFRAGFGNDTGQPNLGDYSQSVAQRGELFAVYAQTSQVGFTDGEPTSAQMSTPDFNLTRVRPDGERIASLSLGEVTFQETGGNGNLDPGELAFLRFPLRNFVTNPLSATTLRGVFATLETSTPGVVVVNGFTIYPNLAPDDTRDNLVPFIVFLSQSFVPGTPIEFKLRAFSSGGTAVLLHTQLTGTPSATTIFSENFDSAATGALPTGWTAVHAAGARTTPWITRNDFCGATSNAA